MPDAFTYNNGNESRTFKSRAEMYDYMMERGELILEGDDAAKYAAHVERRVNHPKQKDTLARLKEHGVI